jgi:hypothetical protein
LPWLLILSSELFEFLILTIELLILVIILFILEFSFILLCDFHVYGAVIYFLYFIEHIIHTYFKGHVW